MSRSAPWLAPVLALVGSLGIAAAWILLAASLDRQCSWMAVLAAFDAALLLRFGRIRGGWARAGWGVAATVLTIALANWGIAATELGQALGLLPWESMRRMGAEHAWLLARLANDSIDLAWLGAALVVAAVTSR
jgi:hypothetical protein